MKNQLLKVVAEMPCDAAYWLGKRDAYQHKINELLQQTSVTDLVKKQAELKSLYWWLDLANDTFTKQMGWA